MKKRIAFLLLIFSWSLLSSWDMEKKTDTVQPPIVRLPATANILQAHKNIGEAQGDGAISSHPLKRPVPPLDFVRVDHNRIYFPEGSQAFEPLFRKIDTLLFYGEGTVNVVHMGGSHVQAGVLTHQFRSNLLTLSPGIVGGRGLIFPFSVAKTNNPVSFKTYHTGKWSASRNVEREPKRDLGVTGIAVTTEDRTATITIALREPALAEVTDRFDFNSLRLLGYADDDRICPIVVLDGDTIRGVPDEQHTGYFFSLPNYTDSLRIAFEWGTAKGCFTLTGILLENNLPGITCHAIGVNGAAVPSYFRCVDFERDLGRLHPDLMIFSIGINDASGKRFSKEAFIDNYHLLVDKVLRINPDCAILFVTNNDSFIRLRRRSYRVNPNAVAVEEAFFTLAKEYRTGVWNLFDIMGGLGSMKKWEEAGLARPDKVHFTNQGYALLGDLLFNAFVDAYVNYLKS